MDSVVKIPCVNCKTEKELTEFDKHPRNTKRYFRSSWCKKCNRERKRKAYKNNPQHYKDYSNNWAAKNRDKKNKRQNELRRTPEHRKKANDYCKMKRRTDEKFAMAARLRGRLRDALSKKYWRKHGKFKDYIGCTLDELKAHIEKYFAPGMTWENRDEWHLDHVQSLNSARDENHMLELCHYTNVRPMWGRENIQKSDYTVEEYQELFLT